MLSKKMMFCFVLVEMMFFLIFSPKEANAIGIAASWDPNTETELAGYNVYISSTYQRAVRLVGDIAFLTVGDVSQPSFCYATDSGFYEVVFVAVTALDISENESDPTIGYILLGNIWGTYSDGISYLSARVDGMDLINLGLYFGQMVIHQQIDCDSYFTIELPTLKQSSDLNGNGRIDGFDLIELGLKFGNTAQ